MQAPKIPSLFKTQKSKSFSFTPRYYEKEEEAKKKLNTTRMPYIKFNHNNQKRGKKARSIRIIILIIILSLFAYKFIIN